MPQDISGPQSVYASAAEELLLLRSSPPTERADAARNRAAVLDAAAALFSRHGIEAVSMDAIAAAAGVGKGTLFRRFGDKAGLAVALLDEQERSLQEAILFGPAPLGPGTPGDDPGVRERLRAFVAAYLDYLLAHLPLVRMSETASPGARYRIGAYRFWHRHVSLLLQDRDDPQADAHTLLAALAADHVHAVADEIGATRVRQSVQCLADVLTA
ncbi:TetR family transcriptional regulator [Actinoplanes sp. SE50]|uniref:TetR/AcrR family transcriptional regulator n=1 Tax=unclassified Actinoplanes TaxID=2626549 RepID=UPI00023EBF3F|nr:MULTISPECIES: TetR/AcrR family transcriptional regulator [unclassified Actinoplanes]AEV85150.1 HTH-type transcriptional regulator betI [Actinoplanes sp. SE50/110]ATO83541.1 TetR family transcriptional regulator [Actinoplanes sp. SE50]SLM00948.1 TetR family transcriptional regulator [Actinoplanes sp. SE50/110]